MLDSSQEPSRQLSDDAESSHKTSRGSNRLDVSSSHNGSSSVDAEGSRTDTGGALDNSIEAGEQGTEMQADSSEGLSADEPDPFHTVVIEQCIAWGGELRVRMQITLAIAGAVAAISAAHSSSCQMCQCVPNKFIAARITPLFSFCHLSQFPVSRDSACTFNRRDFSRQHYCFELTVGKQ